MRWVKWLYTDGGPQTKVSGWILGLFGTPTETPKPKKYERINHQPDPTD